MFVHSWMFPEFPILLWLQGCIYRCQKSLGKCADNLGNIQTSKSKAFKESENLLFLSKIKLSKQLFNVSCIHICSCLMFAEYGFVFFFKKGVIRKIGKSQNSFLVLKKKKIKRKRK